MPHFADATGTKYMSFLKLFKVKSRSLQPYQFPSRKH